MPKIKSIAWLGTPHSDPAEMVKFYRTFFDMTPVFQDENYVQYRLGDGAMIELFGGDAVYPFMQAPIAGLEVDDLAAMRAKMEAGGIAFFGPVHVAPDGTSRYSHFRAPDGFVYELTEKMELNQTN